MDLNEDKAILIYFKGFLWILWNIDGVQVILRESMIFREF